jgi:hypothetical protein
MYVIFSAKRLIMLSTTDFMMLVTVERIWNIIGIVPTGKNIRTLSTTCPSADLSVTNPTLIGVGVN